MSEIAKKLEDLKHKDYQEKVLKGKELGKTQITISTLTSEEEMNCHLYAQQYEKMGYIYSLKKETLAYCIKQIDDTDLRNVKFIETKEKDGNDKPIKVQKNIFLRDILSTWNQETLNYLFMEYASLYNLTTLEMEKAVEFIGKQVGKIAKDSNIDPNDIANL